jgi:uncharacterized membrane protein YqjE
MVSVELDVVLGFVKEYSLQVYGGSGSEIAGFGILTTVAMVIQVFWDATTYRLQLA